MPEHIDEVGRVTCECGRVLHLWLRVRYGTPDRLVMERCSHALRVDR